MSQVTPLHCFITALLSPSSDSRDERFPASHGGAQPQRVGSETSAGGGEIGTDLRRERAAAEAAAAGEREREKESRGGCEREEG